MSVYDDLLSRAARTTGAALRARALASTRRRRLVDARHALMLAALEDCWWRPWRRRRRLRGLAAVEAALAQPVVRATPTYMAYDRPVSELRRFLPPFNQGGPS